MKICVFKRTPKVLNDFNSKEWDQYDIKHYGQESVWSSGKYSIVAKEGKKVVGMVKFQHDGGVVYLKSIIVVKDFQGKGIGKSLMKKLEEIAKKLNCHKIYFYTGKDWEAIKFYEKLGYIKTSDLPNHYMHKDFLEYTKFL